MADTTRPKVTSLLSLKQRCLRRAKEEIPDRERQAAGKPALKRSVKKPFTPEELERLAGFVPQPFKAKRKREEAKAVDTTSGEPTAKRIRTKKIKAPIVKVEDEDELPKWHDVPINPADKVLIDDVEEHTRLVLKFPMKFKTEYKRMVGGYELERAAARGLVPSHEGGNTSKYFNIERHLTTAKANSRIAAINKRRAERNMIEAAENSYSALHSSRITCKRSISGRHLERDQVIKMSASEIITLIGQQTSEYYFSLFQYYKTQLPEVYAVIIKHLLDVDLEIEMPGRSQDDEAGGSDVEDLSGGTSIDEWSSEEDF